MIAAFGATTVAWGQLLAPIDRKQQQPRTTPGFSWPCQSGDYGFGAPLATPSLDGGFGSTSSRFGASASSVIELALPSTPTSSSSPLPSPVALDDPPAPSLVPPAEPAPPSEASPSIYGGDPECNEDGYQLVFGDGQYRLGERIAGGNHGTIYKCTKIATGEEFAAKIDESDYRANEHDVYEKLAGGPGISKVEWAGAIRFFYIKWSDEDSKFKRRASLFHEHADVLVMELLGDTLKVALTTCGGKVGLRTGIWLALQMSRNLCFDTFKLDSFILTPDRSSIRLVDFGRTKAIGSPSCYLCIDTPSPTSYQTCDDFRAVAYYVYYLIKGRHIDIRKLLKLSTREEVDLTELSQVANLHYSDEDEEEDDEQLLPTLARLFEYSALVHQPHAARPPYEETLALLRRAIMEVDRERVGLWEEEKELSQAEGGSEFLEKCATASNVVELALPSLPPQASSPLLPLGVALNDPLTPVVVPRAQPSPAPEGIHKHQAPQEPPLWKGSGFQVVFGAGDNQYCLEEPIGWGNHETELEVDALNGKVGLRTGIWLALQMFETFQYLHSSGLSFTCFKLDSFILTSDRSSIRLVDFGRTRLADNTESWMCFGYPPLSKQTSTYLGAITGTMATFGATIVAWGQLLAPVDSKQQQRQTPAFSWPCESADYGFGASLATPSLDGGFGSTISSASSVIELAIPSTPTSTSPPLPSPVALDDPPAPSLVPPPEPVPPSKEAPTTPREEPEWNDYDYQVVFGDGQYGLGERIAGGNHGQIFKCTKIATGDVFAARVDASNHRLNEHAVYKKLAGGPGIAKVEWAGTIPTKPKSYYDWEFNRLRTGSRGVTGVLVMELLGETLQDALTTCGGRFGIRTVIWLALQMHPAHSKKCDDFRAVAYYVFYLINGWHLDLSWQGLERIQRLAKLGGHHLQRFPATLADDEEMKDAEEWEGDATSSKDSLPPIPSIFEKLLPPSRRA
ncbi:hypothetical protein MNV49_003266 [Pseudohyphozyma bogoriensis]|nr:hypothetical protein MNV49_003266 [Pseudohyphozyma bogoriensis]